MLSITHSNRRDFVFQMVMDVDSRLDELNLEERLNQYERVSELTVDFFSKFNYQNPEFIEDENSKIKPFGNREIKAITNNLTEPQDRDSHIQRIKDISLSLFESHLNRLLDMAIENEASTGYTIQELEIHSKISMKFNRGEISSEGDIKLFQKRVGRRLYA